jgi:hypothetical protein
MLGYLADLAKSVGKDGKDASLSRPDLLVVGIRVTNGRIKHRSGFIARKSSDL